MLRTRLLFVSALALSLGALACSDDDTASPSGAGGSATAGSSGSAGEGGSAGNGGSAGDGGSAGNGGSAGDGGSAGNGGSAGDGGSAGNGGSAGDGGSAGSGAAAGSAGSAGAAGDGGSAGSAGAKSCEAERNMLIKPIDKVATTQITILSESNGVRTLIVDATAGGFTMSSANPWIYMDLKTAKAVAVTDPQSFTDGSWDIGFKRNLIRSNSGDSGPAMGGSVFAAGADFDAFSKADAEKLTLSGETWFSADCIPKLDQTNKVMTSFGDWYDYMSMKLSPKAGVWVVRGAKGDLYKMEILSYYSNLDGSDGPTSARFRLKLAAL